MIGIYVGFLFGSILFYAAFRQVRLVKYAYSLTGPINLFTLQPLYALSTLTAKAGIALFLLTPLNYLQNIVLTPYELGLGFVIINLALTTSLAGSAFLVPLWTTHNRIVETKEEQLEKNGEQLSLAAEGLEARMKKKDMSEMDQFEKAISALMILRAEIDKTSTWPWDPSTLRGFLSAIMLPIFLILLQQLLVRFL